MGRAGTRTSATPIVINGEEFCCYYRESDVTRTEWRNQKGDTIRRNYNKETFSAWNEDGDLIGKRFLTLKNAAMAIINSRDDIKLAIEKTK